MEAGFQGQHKILSEGAGLLYYFYVGSDAGDFSWGCRVLLYFIGYTPGTLSLPFPKGIPANNFQAAKGNAFSLLSVLSFVEQK